jgi:hypothetical protein
MTAVAALTDEQAEILRTIHEFVDRDVLLNVARYDPAIAPIERRYRDAPVLILGEGSNEIQQLVIARRIFRASRSDPLE